MSLTYTFRDGTTTNDAIEWAKKFEDDEYRHVAYDRFSESDRISWAVSTIWQGLPSIGGAPNNYETLVRIVGASPILQRHHTEDEAQEYHRRIVDALLAGRFEEVTGD